MAYPLVVDGRNLFDDEAMLAAGFDYYSIGRAPRLQPLLEGDSGSVA
jgi:hypothetical protein